MLRTELQVALNDVIVACQEAADGHETAADVIPDAGLAARLKAFVTERREAAERLGEHLRELGDLPRVPDSDLEALRDLVSRFKSALSPEEWRSLLDDRIQAEQHLVACARAALALEQREATKALLHEIEHAAIEACEYLTSLQPE
jgi:Domain of unknown function (DUF2383)